MRPAIALLLMWLTPVPVIQPGLPVFVQVTGYLCRKDLFWAASAAWSSNVGIPPFFIPMSIFWPFLDSEENYCFKSKLKIGFCRFLPCVFKINCPESFSFWLLTVSAFGWTPSTTEKVEKFLFWSRVALRGELELYKDRSIRGELSGDFYLVGLCAYSF